MTERLPPDYATAVEAAAPRLCGLASRLVYVATLPSTNDLAASLAGDGAADGTTVLAGRQTAGRGRRGHEWFSPPDAGVYFSCVLRSLPVPTVTLMAGVALAEAVRTTTGLAVELKWPNDLMLSADARRAGSGRAAKLGGILTETSRVGDTHEAIILGIGINVRSVAYPPGLGDRASSLEAELGQPVDRAAVFVETLAALARWRPGLSAGQTAMVLDRWRELAPSCRGAAVSWHDRGRVRHGTTAGVDGDGALLVRHSEGVERIVAGEVTWPQTYEGATARAAGHGNA